MEEEEWEEGAHLEAETLFASASPPYKETRRAFARTLPSVGGNMVEQGLPKSNCLQTDP